MSRLALYLLGPPRLERDGQPVHLGRRKAVALLAYLAVTGRRHGRDAVATMFWPDYDQTSARGRLRRTLSTLSSALGAEQFATDRETAGLAPEADLWLDIDRFHRRLAACESQAHAARHPCGECLALLSEAAELCQDEFMAGFTLPDSLAFDEWQRFQAQGLRDELASILERLTWCHSARGEFEPAIAHARRWLELDPTHEAAHRGLMELYGQAGRRGAALRQYRACVRILEEELGIAPSAETTALYERVQAERAGGLEREAVAPGTARPTTLPPALPAFLTQEAEPISVERDVFVARERELAALNGHLEAALAGEGRVVFISGGPGRGKTALAREFARRAMAAHADLLVASGSGKSHSGVGDGYLPFREVLALLTGDVEGGWSGGTLSTAQARRLWHALPWAVVALLEEGPHLIDTLIPGAALVRRAAVYVPDGSADGAWWRGRREELEAYVAARTSDPDLPQSALFQQCTRVLGTLARQKPLLLILDDLQWADGASIGLLFHLGRALAGERMLIVGAYRPEEVALERGGQAHPLERVVAEFKRRFGEAWVDLAEMAEVEGRRFVDALFDSEANRLGEGFRRAMFEHTGGHALFTVELLRAMQERGDLVRDAEESWVEGPALDWGRLPARVEAVIAARVRRLGRELREILEVASVEGERFTAQVVARVEGIPEREMLRALSMELGTRHRLVREAGEVQVDGGFLSRYAFAHALFQEYLYHALSAGERRLLHGEVGAALEELYGDGAAEMPAQLAHHYSQAGRREKATEYAVRAGDQARRAYANDEAITHYRGAMELLGGASGAGITHADKAWRVAALQGLGRVLFGTGEVSRAKAHLREAIALGREIELAPRELVRLHYWLAETLFWQSAFDEEIRVAGEGLALLGGDVESTEAAMMYNHLAWGHWAGDSREKWREYGHRIGQFLLRLPYSPELRTAHKLMFWVSVNEKDTQGALRWLQALEERAAPRRDLRALAEMQLGLGQLLRLTGDLQGALSRYRKAEESFNEIGDRMDSSRCSRQSVAAFLDLGDLDRARVYALEGLETAEAVGDKVGVADSCMIVGVISLCRGGRDRAAEAFRTAAQFWGETGSLYSTHAGQAAITVCLGRLCLEKGKRAEARKWFLEALALASVACSLSFNPPYSWAYALSLLALNSLEEAYDDPRAFRGFCDRYREEHPGVSDAGFANWYLVPTKPDDLSRSLLHEDFGASLSTDWVWHDPFGDGSFAVQDGLVMHAANGRDLWYLNLSAPRLLHAHAVPEASDWAAQTACGPVSEEKPAMGGLLLWKDKENYLRLERGLWGSSEISFVGCLGNQDVVIGRGRLPSQRAFLRLERVGCRVKGLCSADGVEWFSVGSVEFAVEEPLQVGLHAIGSINRVVYPGAFPDGTAMRFESFELWGR